MTKTPTKTSETTKAVAEVPERVPMFDPWARMSLSDWFDRWPEMFQRRWPESFRGIPFGDDGFRMEQFVEEDGTSWFAVNSPDWTSTRTSPSRSTTIV